MHNCMAMTISLSAQITFTLPEPVDLLMQFEAAAIPEQQVLSATTTLPPAFPIARVPAKDGIGERIWVRAEGEYHVEYSAKVQPRRILADITRLDRLSPHDLPGEATEYLFESRYCQSGSLQWFVADTFGHLTGGAQVEAMRRWLFEHFQYAPGSSGPHTTAVDSFNDRRGICRDYAHVLISFARAAAIPARYVSCFAPGVSPQDFHAIAEVFLDDPAMPGGGAWHMVDGTGMADPAKTVKIGVGRDAADVSFLTAFGQCLFDSSEVRVRETAD